jgi:hypothetical protein
VSLDKSLSFRTERFDYSSKLPAECNAGNRFYGGDAVAYLREQLAESGLQADFVDEDWGWLLYGDVAPSTSFEIAAYNLNEHGLGDRPGAPEWGLWIREFQPSKTLGLIPKRVQIAVPEVLLNIVSRAITSLGAVPVDWLDGPGN